VTADHAAISVADAITGASPVVRMLITVEVDVITIWRVEV
jgi:hypothetical protein